MSFNLQGPSSVGLDNRAHLVQPTPFKLSAASLFTHTICVSCLVLQRFGLNLGHAQLLLSLPIVPVAIISLILLGKARVRASSAVCYGLLLCVLLASSITAILAPDYQMRFSLLSLAELLVIYSFVIFEPTSDFDSRVVFRVFIFYARLIAVFSILQFGLQFVHVRLFSFAQLMPFLRPILVESGYHTVAPLKYGASLLRSNGFFLLEPSIMSQLMALAIIVEFFVLNRWKFLSLYLAAMLASFSGTGPLVLGLSLFVSGLMSPRQLPRTITFGAIALMVVALCALAFPAEFATLAARAHGHDASAALRYGAQLEALKTILNDPRVVIGFGPGSADGLVVTGAMSAGLKLLFDYGLFGVLVFLLFWCWLTWCRDYPVVTIACLFTFQLGGGYLVFAPIVFLITLLCIWGRPARLPIARRRAHAHGAQRFVTA